MWIGRRFRHIRNWYSSQWRLVKVSVLLAALTSPCLFCIGGAFIRGQYVHWFILSPEDRSFIQGRRERQHPYEEGVPSAARKLIAEMESHHDPDEALVAHPDWFEHRFPNGEWVFGYGIDSHGYRVGGGTLVIKDSRGRIRVFFGHVCGTNGGFPWNLQYVKSLEDLESSEFVHLILREWMP